MQKQINEIIKEITELPKRKDKIAALRSHGDNAALKNVLKYTFDPNIKFALPPGSPPYKPSEFFDETHNRLYAEARKLYLFVEGGNPNLKALSRERHFIELLESIDPEDAKLLLAVKEKKLPWTGLTAKIVQEAWPGIF
jgi:hypothetical protein